MCVCIVCVYVCIHVMRVVRLRHKLTYCFFPFSWVDPTHSGGGGGTNPEPGIIYIYICIIELKLDITIGRRARHFHNGLVISKRAEEQPSGSHLNNTITYITCYIYLFHDIL